MDPMIREALEARRRSAGVVLLLLALGSMFAAGKACGEPDAAPAGADAGEG